MGIDTSPAGRDQVAKAAAAGLRAWSAMTGESGPAGARVTLGLDGFVDQIISVVEKRFDAHTTDTVPTIRRFTEKLAEASGQSANYELLVRQQKMGGNGPLMCMAMAVAGVPCTYIGALGLPTPHEVFRRLAEAADVISIAAPAQTDAMEFTDGKLMFGKLESLLGLSWQSLAAEPGIERLVGAFLRSRLVGMVNWTMIPGMTGVWQGIVREVMPRLTGERRWFFVDLADPEKRTDDDIREAATTLGVLQGGFDVVLGLNLKEARHVAAAVGAALPRYFVAPTLAQEAIDLARCIREHLGLAMVVVHPRQLAAAATAHGAWHVDGPFVHRPKLSTGAGDNFNGGFAVGLLAGLPVARCLAVGVATSGYYVRNGLPPEMPELVAFLEALPPPEPHAA